MSSCLFFMLLLFVKETKNCVINSTRTLRKNIGHYCLSIVHGPVLLFYIIIRFVLWNCNVHMYSNERHYWITWVCQRVYSSVHLKWQTRQTISSAVAVVELALRALESLIEMSRRWQTSESCSIVVDGALYWYTERVFHIRRQIITKICVVAFL